MRIYRLNEISDGRKSTMDDRHPITAKAHCDHAVIWRAFASI